MNPIIELKTISLSYRKHPIVVNMDAKILEHRVTCIVGRSGVGKSTLLRTLNRMNDFIPSFHCEGQVLFDGNDIYDRDCDVDHLRQKIGMVSQEPCIFPRSVYDNVLFGLQYLKRKRKNEYPKIVEETLKAVFLWKEVKDKLLRPAAELSQGQQQRLSIARALAVEPQILLLDEPTSSLDHETSEAIERLLKDSKEKITFVLATHKLKQVERIADDVISL